MEHIALIMNNTLSRLAADLLLCCIIETDNSKSHQSVTIRKLHFLSGFSPPSQQARQSTSLDDTFENDNKHFKRL